MRLESSGHLRPNFASAIDQVWLVLGRGSTRAFEAVLSCDLALTRVWEKGKNGGDSAGRSNLAGGDCNEQFHNIVIDLATARLDDEDVFASDRLSNLDAGLADCEFAKEAFGWRDSQVIANGLCELGVGTATEYADISHHALLSRVFVTMAWWENVETAGSLSS